MTLAAQRGRPNLGRFALELTMLFLAGLVLVPIVFMIVSSFKDRAEINRPLALPSSLRTENFRDAIIEGDFVVLLFNSVLVAALSLAVIVVITALASYSIARNSRRRYTYLYYYFLSGLMIPFISGVIPLYEFITVIGLNNTRVSLVLISIGQRLPLAILIYTGFVRTVPMELEDAARIDGCTRTRTFLAVVFPLLKPATISVLIMSIIPIWNDFMTPLIFIESNSRKTLPLGMYNFMGEFSASYGPIFAFSLLSCVVPVVLFLSLQKHFYKGLISGSVK